MAFRLHRPGSLVFTASKGFAGEVRETVPPFAVFLSPRWLDGRRPGTLETKIGELVPLAPLGSNVKVAAAMSSEISTPEIAPAAAMVPVFPRAVSNSDRELDSDSMPVLKVTKTFNNSKEGAAI
jgi:hypothetical protein